MTHSIYGGLSPSSWAIQQLRLNGPAVRVGATRVAGAYPGASVTTSRIDTGTPAGDLIGDGGTPAAGDLLVASVVYVPGGGQAISPPAGWTTLTPVTGLGTENVALATFLKIAAAGDITGSLTFTASVSAALSAFVYSVPQATINTSTPVLGSPGSASAADSTSAAGPDAVGRSIFEVFASRGSPGATRDDGGDIYFINRSLDGIGGGGPGFPGLLGFRYYPPFGGWSIDDIRF